MDWKSTIICTALAILASAVFFWQVTRDTSFLSGILGVEYRRLMPPAKGQAREDGGPTWTTVYEDFRSKLEVQPYYAKHNAVGQLLHAVVEVERGKLKAEGIVQAARQVEATDAENWISRLALAYLVDSSMAGKPADERFEAIRQIIDTQPPPRTSTLYNQEYEQLWYETLGKYIKRLDVRANLAKSLDHGQIHEQHAALPIIQRRLVELGSNLADERFHAQMGQWLDKSFTGLFEIESASGTRLLCADMLARTLQETEAKNWRQLRADFLKRSESAAPDLTSMSRSPALLDVWAVLLRDELCATALAAVGIGSLFTLVVTVICSLIAPASQSSELQVGRTNRNGITVLLILALAIVGCLAGTHRAADLHSELVFYYWIIGLFAIGSLIPNLLGSTSRKNGRPSRRVITLMLMVGLLLLVFMPAARLSFGYRAIDLICGIVVTSLTTVFCLAALSVGGNAARLRSVARWASLTWLVASSLSLIVLVQAQFVDSDWQIALATTTDPLEGRLGPNWREDYSIERGIAPRHVASTSAPSP